MKSIISCVEPLSFPFQCLDPFLFCVYHKDLYPSGNKDMEAPHIGNGADFNPNSSYRMYHGNRIPGFPQHPHRGFETITATIEGIIDHTDSMGNAARYGHGDLQWMTAGKGIVHSEMFPLINTSTNNPTKFFQIWMNLPSNSKMVEPEFKMHWSEDIPKYISIDHKATIIIWAGKYEHIQALPPPKNSWATTDNTVSLHSSQQCQKSSSEVGIWHITLQPGGKVILPAVTASSGVMNNHNRDDCNDSVNSNINRMVYFVEGTYLTIAGKSIATRSSVKLNANQDAIFENTCTIEENINTEILVLQGKTINEPVVQHGPFVMNTKEEITQAFEDYRRTQFGGWPWKTTSSSSSTTINTSDATTTTSDSTTTSSSKNNSSSKINISGGSISITSGGVFPREKSRFALINNVEILPPPSSALFINSSSDISINKYII